MMRDLELDKVTIALRLDPKEIDAARTGALALVKATGELLRHCPDDSESTHAFQTLVRWVQMVVPAADARDARRVADTSHPSRDPMWLSTLHFDPHLSAVFPGELVVAGLCAAMPREHNQRDAAEDYVRAAALRAGVSNDDTEMLRGWSDGSAAEAVCEEVEQRLDTLAESSAASASVVRALHDMKGRRRRPSAATKGPPIFHEARMRAITQIDEVLQHAQSLKIEVSGLQKLRGFLEQDYFRVAVLGEFKRGKSTLINALLETPGLMPVDSLPCTSALTAIRYEREEHYYYAAKANDFVSSTRAQFCERAANAATETHTEAEAQTAAEAMPRWRVCLPIPFLKDDFVEFVDSPGLGEDPARDRLAKEEAQRADAAVLVLNAKQLASRDEIKLVVEMKAKLHGLILAINQADLEPEANWPRLLEYLSKRLEDGGVAIPRDRIVFVSASNAEEAAGAHRFSDPWLARMRNLRKVVQQHLLSRSGPLKAGYLVSRLEAEVTEGKRTVKGIIADRKAQLTDYDLRAEKSRKATEARLHAERDITSATASLRDHATLRDALVNAFEDALPSLLVQIGHTRDRWTTEHNPLGSPKKHVKAVAEQAVEHTKVVLEAWFKGEGAKVLESALVARLDAAARQVASLAEYAEITKGQSKEHRAKFFTTLKERTLQDAYEDATHTATDVDAFGRSVLLAVVALVVGYVVADVVLFYVLGAIASFLALPLVIAAVVIGLIAGATKGNDWARAWVRNTIYDKIKEQFQKADSRRKVREGIDKAMRDVSDRLEHSFKKSCDELLREAMFAEQQTREELDEFAKKVGGDREALQSELARIDALASKVYVAFGELEAIARSVRPVESRL